MAGLINDLIDILNEQTAFYRQLLELSEKKKDIIMKNDTDALKKITSSENSLIGKSQRLEKKRLEAVADIAGVLNAKAGDVTLSYLCERIKGQKEHAELLEASREIRAVLDSLKAANETNKLLIENSLEYIQFNINVMQSTYDSAPPLYTAKGEELDSGKSILDIRN